MDAENQTIYSIVRKQTFRNLLTKRNPINRLHLKCKKFWISKLVEGEFCDIDEHNSYKPYNYIDVRNGIYGWKRAVFEINSIHLEEDKYKRKIFVVELGHLKDVYQNHKKLQK